MTYTIIQILLAFSLFQPSPESDPLRDPVVLIQSGSESGTGFLVGNRGETLYILTALHVIDDPSQIDLRFFTSERASARVFQSSDFWDMAVITCQKPERYVLKRSFIPVTQKPSIRDEVITIGHPLGNYWNINYRDEVSDLKYNQTGSFFTITPDGVTHGSSGGPVLNSAKEWIGMVLAEDKIKAVCLSKDLIISVLEEWNVPKNLIIPLLKQYTDPLAGEMILVPGGSFEMGQSDPDIGGEGFTKAEQPPHQVMVLPFYLGKFEITQGQWKAIMGDNPSYFKNGDNYPVEHVSWEDVQEFIKKLNGKSRYTYRLPSEAEWEYAAGGGSNNRTVYAGTNKESELYLYGNFCDKNCTIDSKIKSQNDRYETTAPVGSYKENRLGLKDMSGNVWEWCEDWYHDSYYEAPDNGSPWVSLEGSRRILRGGGWLSRPLSLRVRVRSHFSPNYHDLITGFRLARTP